MIVLCFVIWTGFLWYSFYCHC